MKVDISFWEAARWIGTTVVATGGLVLGIRAERRATHYRAFFDITENREDATVTLVNRTGDSARNVSVFRASGGIVHQAPLVRDGDDVTLQAGPVSEFSGADDPLMVRWYRATTNVEYEQTDVVPGQITRGRLAQLVVDFRNARSASTRRSVGGRRFRR